MPYCNLCAVVDLCWLFIHPQSGKSIFVSARGTWRSEPTQRMVESGQCLYWRQWRPEKMGGEAGVNRDWVSLLFLLWDAQHSLVSVPTVLLGMLVILPIFECKRLFEGGANVTQQVSQTVTNWRWLCKARIKHILRGADKENEHGWFRKQNIWTNAHH